LEEFDPEEEESNLEEGEPKEGTKREPALWSP